MREAVRHHFAPAPAVLPDALRPLASSTLVLDLLPFHFINVLRVGSESFFFQLIKIKQVISLTSGLNPALEK